MLKYLRYIYTVFKYFGIDFKRFFFSVKNLPSFVFDILKFTREKEINKITPILNEKNFTTLDKHLFQIDLNVAKRIYKSNPLEHLDVGSRVEGLVSSLASFRKIDVLDIRPFINNEENINFIKGDILKIDTNSNKKYDSISSIGGPIAHAGLGRYGDKIDVDGDKKTIKVLSDLLKSNGTLYLGIHTGKNEINFNSHRTYEISNLKNMLKKNNLEVKEIFSFDSNAISENNKDYNHNSDYFISILICKKE